MPDRELLLERLERLAIVLDEFMPQCAGLVRDALALLKEQEAKQTPKDIKSYYGLAGGPHGVCPSCCTTIPRIIGQETRSCPFCGQAVKWE